MNLSGLGALMGGANDGLMMAARLQAMQDMQAQHRARAAVGRMLLAGPQDAMPGGAPMPQPPMPGAPSMPKQDAVPPVPGQSFDPDGNLFDASRPDPTEMGAFNLGGAPPLPPPMGGPGLPPEPAAVGAGGDPLAGAAAGTGNIERDSQSTILNIARQLKTANPDISPEQMFDAVNLHIEQMKGVRNDVKDYMTAQVEMVKAQMRLQQTQMRVQGQENVAGINADARTGAAQIRSDAQENVANINAGSRERVAGTNAASRERVAGTQAGARRYAADAGADSRRDVASTNAEASGYRADQARAGRENAASIGMGTAPKVPWNGPRAPRAAPSRYKTADDVKAAYTAGKITREAATQILRTQFGMK